MYEIGVVGILLPGKEHGKKSSQPTDAFKQNRHCIVIETLRNFPSAPLRVSSVL